MNYKDLKVELDSILKYTMGLTMDLIKETESFIKDNNLLNEDEDSQDMAIGIIQGLYENADFSDKLFSFGE